MKGGMMQTERRKPMSEINVVPYIDVMLVLLVIFMVTAPMLTQGVKVDLPETTSDPIQAEKDTESVVVSVDVNGAYYLQVGDDDSDPMPLEQVQEMVGKIMGAFTEGVHHTGAIGALVSVDDLRKTDPVQAARAYREMIAGHLTA